MTNLTELKQIYEEIRSWNPDFDINKVLEVAQRIFISNNISNQKGYSKPLESENITPQPKETSQRAINPITDNQKRLLLKAIEQGSWKEGNRELVENMSKQEAFYQIQELMGK